MKLDDFVFNFTVALAGLWAFGFGMLLLLTSFGQNSFFWQFFFGN